MRAPTPDIVPQSIILLQVGKLNVKLLHISMHKSECNTNTQG